jgi:hypothetical protein
MPGSGGGSDDRHTGYYLAGHDWPAIESDLGIRETYTALSDINDDDVRTAIDSLLEVEASAEHRPDSE